MGAADFVSLCRNALSKHGRGGDGRLLPVVHAFGVVRLLPCSSHAWRAGGIGWPLLRVTGAVATDVCLSSGALPLAAWLAEMLLMPASPRASLGITCY